MIFLKTSLAVVATLLSFPFGAKAASSAIRAGTGETAEAERKLRGGQRSLQKNEGVYVMVSR